MNRDQKSLKGTVRGLSLAALMMLCIVSGAARADECVPTGNEVQDRLCILKNHYVAGRYDQVVGELALVQGSLRPEEYFYLGMSFYQLMQGTHAPGMRCDYRKKSRDVLRRYLEETKSAYDRAGSWGSSVELAQTYAAARIMDDTGKVMGCLENGMTAMEMELASTQFARDILQRIQLKTRPKGLAADAPEIRIYDQGVVMWDAIQDLTRTFVSSASYLETELSKKQTQHQAAVYNTEKIKESLATLATIDAKDGRINDISLSNNAEVEKVDEWLRGVETLLDNNAEPLGFKQKFNKALGEDMTPEKYAELQKQKIKSAKQLVMALSFGASVVQQEVNQDNSAVGRTTQMYGGNASATLSSLRTKWREYGTQKGLCRAVAGKPWYCN